MELGIFERQLRLMVLLTQNRTYTPDELARKLDISRRTVYRYIELFRDTGFVLRKQGDCYRLDKSSPFFAEITELVHFTEDEALTLRHVLDGLSDVDVRARQLRRKLERIYDFGVLNTIDTDQTLADNLHALYDALKGRRQVVLHDYCSANSNRTTDRVVEPYLFLQNHNEVRCYEPRTGENKTFKVSRIGRVEVLDLLWANEELHTPVFTDPFHFSGTDTREVCLRLGRLAASLLREEYPQAARLLTADGPDHWQLTTRVCSFQGVGRFVLGVFEDVEVLDSPDFRHYLQEKAEDLTKKLRE